MITEDRIDKNEKNLLLTSGLVSDRRDREACIGCVQVLIAQEVDPLGILSAQAHLEDFFSLFATEVRLYELTGAGALAIAIANDVTLTWLDNPYQGADLRAAIIARL